MADAIASCVHCGFCLPTLPDLRHAGRGDGLAARAHLPDEGGARGRARARGGAAVHRQLPGLPGVRDGLPVGRRVRRPDHAVSRAMPRSGARPPAARARAARAACCTARCRIRGASGRPRGSAALAEPLRRLAPAALRPMLDLLPDAAAGAAGRCPPSTPPSGRRARASRCWPAARSRCSIPRSAGRRCACSPRNGVETVDPARAGLLRRAGDARRATASWPRRTPAATSTRSPTTSTRS